MRDRRRAVAFFAVFFKISRPLAFVYNPSHRGRALSSMIPSKTLPGSVPAPAAA
jgi:hypothetical protein